MIGFYNRAIHKQVLIRIDTKKRMDDMKRKYDLHSYNAVINYLIDRELECRVPNPKSH